MAENLEDMSEEEARKLEVKNVFLILRNFSDGLYLDMIMEALRSKGCHISRQPYFEARVDTALYILTARGLITRKRDGRYCLTYEGKETKELKL